MLCACSNSLTSTVQCRRGVLDTAAATWPLLSLQSEWQIQKWRSFFPRVLRARAYALCTAVNLNKVCACVKEPEMSNYSLNLASNIKLQPARKARQAIERVHLYSSFPRTLPVKKPLRPFVNQHVPSAIQAAISSNRTLKRRNVSNWREGCVHVYSW